MPTVPISQKRVGASAFKSRGMNINASTGAESSNVTQGLSQVVKQATQIGMREKKKADDLAVTSAYTKLKTKKDIRLHGEKGEGGGYFSQKGLDPLNSYESYKKDFQGDVDELLGTIGSKAARKRFSLAAERVTAEFSGQMNNHAVKEKDFYNKKETQSSIARLRETAA
ncbi:MAG: hypothetical protein DRG30_10125, partial [Epsilonproteobacteria bacterium]